MQVFVNHFRPFLGVFVAFGWQQPQKYRDGSFERAYLLQKDQF